MYSEKILELFKNPINAGGLQGANGVGKFIDNACGDNIKIYLKIDESGIITEARFKALGSVGIIVACSAICSCLLDCTIDEAKDIKQNRIQEITGVFPKDKLYCLEYAIKTVSLAIDDYYDKLKKNFKKAEKKPLTPENKIITEAKHEVKTPETNNIVLERRTVSAAKAAFDALFE